jgi:hypothetical protein
MLSDSGVLNICFLFFVYCCGIKTARRCEMSIKDRMWKGDK